MGSQEIACDGPSNRMDGSKAGNRKAVNPHERGYDMNRMKHHTRLPIAGDMTALVDLTAHDFAGHEEWLLDESLRETFPASDPISPAVPAGGTPVAGRAGAPTRRRKTSP
jgi:hypothetical protein